jgi:hypothetical protein
MSLNRALAILCLFTVPFCGYLFVRELWASNPFLAFYALVLSASFWFHQLGVACGWQWKLVDAE